MTLTDLEQQLLERTLDLARRARADGDPPFGSLLADARGNILAEERNTTLSEDDITAHPELKLARWAARTRTPEPRAGLTLFTSCEPCPMCGNAIGRAGITRVVFALSNAQLNELKLEGLSDPSARWIADGPHLHPASAEPLIGYYG